MKLIDSADRLQEKSKHFGKLLTLEHATFTNIQLRKGEEIAEHDSPNEAIIIVRKGNVRFIVEGEDVIVTPETVLHMAPKEQHSLHAIEDTDLILIQVTP